MNAVANKVVANELLPVYETETGQRVVDARELHQFLEIGRDFTNWMKDRIEKYGFINGDDYSVTLTKIGERQNVTRHDYILKLDVAKELCMVENNEQGSRARKYFIEVEKRFKNESVDVSKLDPQMQMFHLMFQSVAKMQLQADETQQKLTAVTEAIETMQETFLQRDEEWRESVNSMVKGIVFRTQGVHQDIRNKSYVLLEERARCDLNARLRNFRKRLEESGATKTQVKNANRMDVIENDGHLKEIYSTVVKEMSIGSMRVAR